MFALGGTSTAVSTSFAQETSQLTVEGWSESFGGVSVSLDAGSVTYEDGTATLVGEGWTFEAAGKTVTVESTTVTVEDISEETYQQLGQALAESAEARTPLPFLSALGASDVSRDTPVQIDVSSVATADRTVADSVVVEGTLGGIVPDGATELDEESSVLDLGASTFESVTVTRGSAELSVESVSVEYADQSLVVTAAAGEATTSSRSASFEEMEATVAPPAELSASQSAFVDAVLEQASGDVPTIGAVLDALEQSDVDAAALRSFVADAQVEVGFASVSRSGTDASRQLSISGTVAEFADLLWDRL